MEKTPADSKIKFVSRGGLKLEHALKTFGVTPKDLVVLDVGSSTGGFVDCLLQNGAQKVYSVDTAYGELAWTLRNDPRVVVMERTNVLHLTELPELVDLVTIDTSWTKLNLVLPVVRQFLKPGAKVITLLKPHYEALDKNTLRGGVLPEIKVEETIAAVEKIILALGWRILNKTESPILGGGGNREFLLLLSL